MHTGFLSLSEQVATAKALGLPHLTLPRTAVEELLLRAGAGERVGKLLDDYQHGSPMPTYGDLRSALESKL